MPGFVEENARKHEVLPKVYASLSERTHAGERRTAATICGGATAPDHDGLS
jgi:hypothetical protein